MRPKVYVKLPKAGLGNMLLTWSRGYVFSKLNNLQLYTSPWAGIRPGAWLRRERKKRVYWGYFKSEGLLERLSLLRPLLLFKKVYEPPVERIENLQTDIVFIFNRIFIEYDFFKELRPHKTRIKESLFNMLTNNMKQRFYKYEKPVIGLHIRRGDFKIGSKVTPLSFFIEVVNSIRSDVKQDLPVTVFTDGNEDEIRPLLDLKAVQLADEKPDILDILLLASSKIVVLSISSTFSYWAGFLSDGIIIKHPEEWHTPLRQPDDPAFSNEAKWKVTIKNENDRLTIN